MPRFYSLQELHTKHTNEHNNIEHIFTKSTEIDGERKRGRDIGRELERGRGGGGKQRGGERERPGDMQIVGIKAQRKSEEETENRKKTSYGKSLRGPMQYPRTKLRQIVYHWMMYYYHRVHIKMKKMHLTMEKC